MPELGQEEIDNLLRGLENGDIDTTPKEESLEEVSILNLTNHDKMIRGRIPVLEVINDKIAKLSTNSLMNHIRKRIEFNPQSIDVMKFSEFTKILPVPTSIQVFKMEPLRGNGLVIIDAQLAFALIENFFGGSVTSSKIEGREFTPIEQSVIKKVTQSVLSNIQEAWTPVHELHVELVRSEINPQFASVVPPAEVVIISRFEVEFDSTLGILTICIPYAMIEPIRSKLYTNFQSERLEIDHTWISQLKERIMEIPLEVCVPLGNAQITGNQLLRLEEGDIIMLDTEVTSLLPVQVDDITKFFGTAGVLRANKAVYIVKDATV